MADSQSRIKIGISTAPNERLDELNRATPSQLNLIHVIETNAPIRHERVLHEFYSEYNLHGEWFKLPKNELEMLCKIDDLEDMVAKDIKSILKIKPGL